MCSTRSGYRGDALYPMEDVSKSLAKATGINLEETLTLYNLRCTAYYAGHVMGAAMFHCQTGSSSILYTGDYNMVADRHLGAAKVPRLMPDVMISESTYATTLRDPRRMRERKLLEAVHATVRDGGKVLVPVFAIGSAQEMSLLIDSFWQRMHLDVSRLCGLEKRKCTSLHAELFPRIRFRPCVSSCTCQRGMT